MTETVLNNKRPSRWAGRQRSGGRGRQREGEREAEGGRECVTFGSPGRADVVHGGHNDVKVEALLRLARVGGGQDAVTIPGVTPAMTTNSPCLSTNA